MDVLFGSNRYNMGQSPYNALDDSSQDHASHVPSPFNMAWLDRPDTSDQVQLDQPSPFNIAWLGRPDTSDQVQLDQPSPFNIAWLGRPDTPETINPAALNI
jgi:hypothetical protein